MSRHLTAPSFTDLAGVRKALSFAERYGSEWPPRTKESD